MIALPEIKVGDTYFIYNENRRVYAKNQDGRSFGAPIYKEHFEPIEVKGETSRSWLCGHWNRKIPKASPWQILHTKEMVDDRCWEYVHRHRISRVVENKTINTETLRKIAALVGYKEGDDK